MLSIKADSVYCRIKIIRDAFRKYGISIPSWFQVLIWIIAIAVLVGVTVNDIAPLVNDYRNDTANVAMKSRLVTNEPFAPPVLILQLPHFKIRKNYANTISKISGFLFIDKENKCVECRRLANVSWDVWRDMNISMMQSNQVNITNEIALALIRKIIRSFENGIDVLDDQYSHWNQPLIDACFYFISWQTDIDKNFGNKDVGNELSIFDMYDSDRRWNGTRLLDYFRARAVKTICDKVEMSVQVPGRANYTCFDLMTQDATPVLWDKYGISMPIPCSATEEVQMLFDFKVTRDDPYSMWTPSESDKTFNHIVTYTEPSCQYHSAFDSIPVYTSALSTEMLSHNWPLMTLKYNMAMRAIERRDRMKGICYNEISAVTCLNKCSKQWIMQQCGCIPFTYQNGINWTDPSLPYCTHKHYHACDPMAHKTMKDKYCEKQCMYPCEYSLFEYNFHMSLDESYVRNDYLGFTVRITPQVSPYVELAWTTKDSPQAFASQIGGILGLYLGLSGLGVFIFIVSCLDFARRLHHHKHHKDTSDNTRAISLWQMLLLSKVTTQSGAQEGKQNNPTPIQSGQDDNTFKELNLEVAEIDGKIQRVQKENDTKIDTLKEKLEEMGKENNDKFDMLLSKLSEIEAKIGVDFDSHAVKL